MPENQLYTRVEWSLYTHIIRVGMTKLIMVVVRENPHRRHYIIHLSIISCTIYHVELAIGIKALYTILLLLYAAVYYIIVLYHPA